MIDRAKLEMVVIELMRLYEIRQPPIPIEAMLQNPRVNMWDEVDVHQLSSGFFRTDDKFAPRMSVARLLAKHIIWSDWGKERQLDELLENDELLNMFTRILVMPSPMVFMLTPSSRVAYTFSIHFEVPESEVILRMRELGYPV